MPNDEDGIRNTVCLDEATISPTAKEKPTKYKRTNGGRTDIERKETHTGDTRLGVENAANALREYALDCKVHLVGKGNKVKYFVGCTAAHQLSI